MDFKIQEIVPPDSHQRSEFGRVVISRSMEPTAGRTTGKFKMCCNRAFLTEQSYEKHLKETSEHGKHLDFSKFPKPPPMPATLRKSSLTTEWMEMDDEIKEEPDEDDDGVDNNEQNSVTHVDNSIFGKGNWTKCELCNLSTLQCNLGRHIAKCHTNGQYKCHYCSCTFTLETSRKRHQVKMHRVNGASSITSKKQTIIARAKKQLISSKITSLSKLKKGERWCPLCAKDFKSTPRLRDHLNSHTGARPYKCNLCGYKFSHSSNLKRHLKVSHGKPGAGKFACDVCTCKFTSINALARHRKHLHPGSSKLSLKALSEYQTKTRKRPTIFNYPSSTEPVVDIPKKNADGFLECNICQKQLTTPQTYRGHMRIHQNLKPYKCEFCGICFRLHATRSQHIKVCHSGGLFPCSLCPCRFAAVIALKNHVKIYHKGEEKSDGIGMSSSSPSENGTNGEDEKNIMTGFKCELCGTVIKQLSDYNSHKKLHAEPKRSQCNLCLKVLSSTVNVRLHQKRAHGDGTHKCPSCCCRYISSHSLFAHLVTDHGMKREEWDFKTKTVTPPTLRRLQFPLCTNENGSNDGLSETPTPSKPEGYQTTENRVECDICHFKFKTLAVVAAHKKKSHFNDGKFKCNSCPCKFTSQQGLIVHTTLYHGHIGKKRQKQNKNKDVNTNTKKILTSNMTTWGRKKLKSILKKGNSSKKIECEICHVKLLNRATLRNHKKNSHFHNGKFKCQKCPCKFLANGGLINHQSRYHAFVNKKDTTQTADAKSPKISKDVATPSVENGSTSKHSGEIKKNYECDLCHLKFQNADSIGMHKKRSHHHSGTFRCTDCCCKFENSSGLIVHRTLYHGHVGIHKQRRIQQVCINKNTSQNKDLADKVSMAETVQCELCLLHISKNTKMSQHVKNCHLHEGNFKCDRCTCKFTSLNGLSRHAFLYHNGKAGRLVSVTEDGDQTENGLISSTSALLRLFQSSRTKLKGSTATITKAKKVVRNSLKRNMGSKTSKCDLCGLEFHKGSQIGKHKKVAHTNGNFKCDKCSCCFHTRHGLIKHAGMHKTGHSSEAKSLKNGKPETVTNTDSSSAPIHKSATSLLIASQKYVRHKCNLCGSTFLKRKSLERHLKKAHTDGAFRCTKCSCTFDNNWALGAHKRNYHNANVSTKSFNKQSFQEKSSPVRSSSTTNQFGESSYGTSALNPEDSLTEHGSDRLSTTPSRSSNTTDKTFEEANMFKMPQRPQREIRQVTPIEQPELPTAVKDLSFKCDLCFKAFSHEKMLSKHMLSHTKPERCSKCDQRFRTKDEVKKHVKTSHGLGEFRCPICTCRFSTNHGMKGHMTLVHKNKYESPIPSASFVDRRFVIEHEKEDVGSDEPFLRLDTAYSQRNRNDFIEDEDCDESEPIVQGILETNYYSDDPRSYVTEFHNEVNMQDYLRVNYMGETDPLQDQENNDENEPFMEHHAENSSLSTNAPNSIMRKKPNPNSRPLKCSTCGVTCFGPTNLREHMESHKDEQNSQSVNYATSSSGLLNCDKCIYQFSSEQELLQHLQVEHDATGRYRCAYCPCTMTTELNLRLHFTKYHT